MVVLFLIHFDLHCHGTTKKRLSFYGNDFGFRQTLREQRLAYAVQVEPTTVVWTEDPNRPWPKPKKRTAAEVSPAGGAAATAGLASPGREIAEFGLASRGLASRKPRQATVAFRHGPSLGCPWMAETGAPASRGGVAAGGMAEGIVRANQVPACSAQLAASRVAAFGSHR